MKLISIIILEINLKNQNKNSGKSKFFFLHLVNETDWVKSTTVTDKKWWKMPRKTGKFTGVNFYHFIQLRIVWSLISHSSPFLWFFIGIFFFCRMFLCPGIVFYHSWRFIVYRFPDKMKGLVFDLSAEGDLRSGFMGFANDHR